MGPLCAVEVKSGNNAPMNNHYSAYFFYIAVTATAYGWYLYRHRNRNIQNTAQLAEAERAGLTEPASLHPIIDPNRCLGSAACVVACPEGSVLGVINGKAQLINPTHCIGHGACKAACPHDAITLVFGSAKRGVDIPQVSPNFESNVPGIFIAGELGGMGLIRNAVEQGRQAIESVRKRKGAGGGRSLDVVIVGAGPAGFSASLAAMQHGLRFVTVEQESFGGTVAHFPRGKVVMTQPVLLPLFGKTRLRETTKEALLDFWSGVKDKTGLKVNYKERVEHIARNGDGFIVETTRAKYETRNVVLAIGRRGTPRKLEVPGEELNKVVYNLVDAEQYRNQQVLVVGGGDAALEAATSIAVEPGTTVTLSYRSEAFGRAKEKNLKRVEELRQAGRLNVMMSSKVLQIAERTVAIEQDKKSMVVPNDAVIICAGGVLPTAFLQKVGISVETKFGTA